MLRTLLTLTLLSGLLFSASHYTVRLAVYKNSEKLHKILKKYPPALKETIRTYKRGTLTYAYTLPTKDKNTLETLLPAYKKIFKDAYIQPTHLQ